MATHNKMSTKRSSPYQQYRRLWICVALCALIVFSACGTPLSPEQEKAAQEEMLRSQLGLAFLEFGNLDLRKEFVALLRGPERSWATMTRNQKRRHMDQHIMPVLSAFYDKYRPERVSVLHEDPDRFGNPNRLDKRLPQTLDCKTCHGGGPANEFEPDFSKPSTLFPLDPNNMPTENDPNPFIAATVKYMREIVTPAMRILLERPKFTCFGCHATKK